MENINQLSQLNTSVLFTNWTQEDFTYIWGGNPFTFKKRTSEWISVGTREHNLGIAKHFAKHLTDRELNRDGVPTNHHLREEFEKNCFLTLEDSQDVPVVKVEIHEDTGLVKSVKKIGKKNPKTGKVIEVKEEEIKEEINEEVSPKLLATEIEVVSKVEKKIKKSKETETFEE